MNKLTLKLLPFELAVWKMHSGQQIPAVPENPPGFWSLTCAGDEISIVSETGRVPPGAEALAGWHCFAVEGPLDFSLTGILVSIAKPLSEANIPIFAISTYTTDHILVRDHQVNHAIKILETAGHAIEFGNKSTG